jgi:hypothetical protein
MEAEHNQVVLGLVSQLLFDVLQKMPRMLAVLHADAVDPAVRDGVVESITHVGAPLCMPHLSRVSLSCITGGGINIIQDVHIQGRVV